jgi:hypothetical protein
LTRRAARPPERLTRAATEAREEALRGLCFCLIYDLCAWLAGARRPVPRDLREYRLEAARRLADPVDRLSRYLDPALLAHWEQALEPFFRSGASLSLEVGEAAPLGAERPEHIDREVRAELRFSERSSLVDAAGGRHPLPLRDWRLEAWISPDVTRVQNAWLRRA